MPKVGTTNRSRAALPSKTMVCRKCARPLAVLMIGRGAVWAREWKPTRPTGLVLPEEMGADFAAFVEAEGLMAYRCHVKCGRRVLVSKTDLARWCADSAEDRFSV